MFNKNDLDCINVLADANGKITHKGAKRHLRSAAVAIVMSVINDNFERPEPRNRVQYGIKGSKEEVVEDYYPTSR